MEEPKAIITITQRDVGDGIHAELHMQVELIPPHTEGETPHMAHMAAMTAVQTITRMAEEAGGGLRELRTFPPPGDGGPWPI